MKRSKNGLIFILMSGLFVFQAGDIVACTVTGCHNSATLQSCLSDHNVYSGEGFGHESGTRFFWSPAVDAIRFTNSGPSKKGDLFLTTVKEQLNYWLLLETVRFDYQAEGTIDVFNDNDQEIKVLSIAISRNSGMTFLDGNEPVSRPVDEDLILLFDITANSRRTISFADHI